jgi:subtilisin family serine protease
MTKPAAAPRARHRARATKDPLSQPQMAKKLHPKLRMIARGDEQVNRLRAELSSVVFVAPRLARGPLLRGSTAKVGPGVVKPAKTGRRLSSAVQVNAFVHLVDGASVPQQLGRRPSRMGSIVSCRLSLADLPKLAADNRVVFIEPADALKRPRLLRSLAAELTAAKTAAPAPRAPVIAGAAGLTETMQRAILQRQAESDGVMIGIIDVQGFDFAHQDFLDANGKTRFVGIWDQGGTMRPAPKNFAYGAEITAKHMNAAIAAQRRRGPAAVLLEPQSQMAPGSHGTHVASIAAGNAGVCPQAEIAAVLVSLTPEELQDSRRSFYDSSRLVDAIRYLCDLAEARGLPLSINVSLGTNSGAHDASGTLNQWVDGVLAKPGRAICVAAGNSGQEKAMAAGDLGWVMGRIHTGGRIAAPGLSADLEWAVVGNTVADVSENELELWYSGQDRMAVSIKPPGQDSFIGPIGPREYLQNHVLPDGTRLSVYNEIFHPSNGDNYIAVYLSPSLVPKPDGSIGGVGAGTWVVRLHGLDIRDGRYHAWIERDDPVELRTAAVARAWRFPSFFSERSNVDERSVSSLACAARVAAVANLDERANVINITSSQGPTRDDRHKPDIAAPGTRIAAANGFHQDGAESPWVEMTGTSMASPYVAGVIAQMLRVQRNLRAAQIIGMLHRTARPLPGASYAWLNDAGYGRMDPIGCLREAVQSGHRFEKSLP